MYRKTGLGIALLAQLVCLAACRGTAAPSEAGAERRTVDVFLLAGQSNMEGVGRARLLPWTPDRARGTSLYHSDAVGSDGQSGRWRPLGPAGWKGGSAPHFGIEVALDELSPAGSEVFLIKHAVGGTSLASDWAPRDGPEYGRLQRVVQAALAELEARGHEPVVRGVFWIQGEADAKDASSAAGYLRNLADFIATLRDSLAPYAPSDDPTAIRFVLGQVMPDGTPDTAAGRAYPFRATVRAALVAVASRAPNVAVVRTDRSFETHASDRDGYRDEDNAHFSAAGLLKLGRRMAAEMAAGERSPQAAPAASTLRVLTYNTYYVFDHRSETKAASDWIARQEPDLVALQELTDADPQELSRLAASWGHGHSELLKQSGFSVGITASRPIEVVDRLLDGLHHGCLHVRIDGVHVFVVHLSPFRWETRTAEAELLLPKIQPLLDAGEDVLVLGDFNAHSPADREAVALYPQLLEKARASDAANAHVENLRQDRFDDSVMERFLGTGLADAVLPFVLADDAPRWTFSTGIWTDEKSAPPEAGSRIDYVLASPSLAEYATSAAIVRRGVVNRTSDHYPVLVDFRR
ncbi:MAG: sialate O-acetylesterase [Planctomycetota bacterium]